MARTPFVHLAMASAWWKWAGRYRRLCHGEPLRWCAVVAAWKDRSWRHTIRDLHHTDADPGRSM